MNKEPTKAVEQEVPAKVEHGFNKAITDPKIVKELIESLYKCVEYIESLPPSAGRGETLLSVILALQKAELK